MVKLVKGVSHLLMSDYLFCVKEERGSDQAIDDDIPTVSSFADAIAFSLETLDPQKFESMRLSEESHAAAVASDPSVGPLNREFVKILRSEVSFEANNHSTDQCPFTRITSYRLKKPDVLATVLTKAGCCLF